LSEESDDSLIPKLKQTRGYKSSILGHQKYRTVAEALNSPVFWDSMNKRLSKVFKELGNFLKGLASV